MSTWHVEITDGALGSGIGTRAESDAAPTLNEQWVWEFREKGEVTLLVPQGVVAYIKRIGD